MTKPKAEIPNKTKKVNLNTVLIKPSFRLARLDSGTGQVIFVAIKDISRFKTPFTLPNRNCRLKPANQAHTKFGISSRISRLHHGHLPNASGLHQFQVR